LRLLHTMDPLLGGRFFEINPQSLEKCKNSCPEPLDNLRVSRYRQRKSDQQSLRRYYSQIFCSDRGSMLAMCPVCCDRHLQRSGKTSHNSACNVRCSLSCIYFNDNRTSYCRLQHPNFQTSSSTCLLLIYCPFPATGFPLKSCDI
jgi:hypothetical protein